MLREQLKDTLDGDTTIQLQDVPELSLVYIKDIQLLERSTHESLNRRSLYASR